MGVERQCVWGGGEVCVIALSLTHRCINALAECREAPVYSRYPRFVVMAGPHRATAMASQPGSDAACVHVRSCVCLCPATSVSFGQCVTTAHTHSGEYTDGVPNVERCLAANTVWVTSVLWF